jgi:hypothetical protein
MQLICLSLDHLLFTYITFKGKWDKNEGTSNWRRVEPKVSITISSEYIYIYIYIGLKIKFGPFE